jgi:hypothetical protein
MKKRIAILTALLAVSVPCLGQPFPNTPTPAQQAAPDKSPAPSHIAVDSIPAKDAYDWAAYWGSIALVVVGFGGVVLGICSLVFLRRQTEATRIAADAALAQANHIANSERAWILERARSEDIDIHWYVWETCKDARVRKSHRKMHGVIVPWNSPPSPEGLIGEEEIEGKYHAGEALECRCLGLPLVSLSEVNWPHRVYHRGQIQRMTRVEFKRLSGMT